MKKYYCNPININYRYQFNRDDSSNGRLDIFREAADPSMIFFRGKYYIFASMTLGVWVSDDLAHWENHRLPDTLPLYDYAPDVRVLGDYVYFSASKMNEVCDFYRTKDVINGPYEKIPGSFAFWDPNLFADDDGRVYFYWGCSCLTPIWGAELDPETMKPIGEKKALIQSDCLTKGYERRGEDNSLDSRSLDEAPYIEGAWMNKFKGRYYLQYAFAGTSFNIYGDGVYVSDSPLGEFSIAKNNPYSFNPGGFMPGAGHGSTMEDKYGNIRHTATMRISMRHPFERRVGIWPAGLDADGELFCSQCYGDWPISVEEGKQDPRKEPEWYLLSYRKKMSASSFEKGHKPDAAADENAQTWWRAASSKPGQWLLTDLGKVYDVRAAQINFADDLIDIPVPGLMRRMSDPSQFRYIDDRGLRTRWVLEGSADGENWFLLEDKSSAETDLPHDFLVWEEGRALRYLKLTILEVPYDQKPCISGLRVFGIGDETPPKEPSFAAKRLSGTDMEVTIEENGAAGYNILWGSSPDKLYHAYMIFGTSKKIGALIKGFDYYVRVDAFNEGGITHGHTVKLG